MTRLRLCPLVLTVVTVLALTACGDGDDVSTGPGGSTTAVTTAPGSTPSSTGEVAGGDKAKAESLLLRQADVPDDYAESSHQRGELEEAQGKELAACAGLSDPATVNEIEVHGPDLTMGELTQVTSQATVVRTEQDAKDDVAGVAGAKFRGCLKDQVAKGLRAGLGGAAVKDAEVERIDVGKFGDATEAVRATVTVVVADRSLSIVQDSVLLVKGRFEATLTFINPGEPFDQDLERTLVATVGKRLEALG